MKRIIAIAALLFAGLAQAAPEIYYVSNCDAGTFSTVDPACVNGNDSWDGLAPNFVSGTNGPKRTFSAIQSLVNNATSVGRIIRLAYGAKWVTASPLSITSCTGGSKCSKDFPLVIEGYTPSWGSGTQWIFEQSANIVLLKFEDSSLSEQDQGYVIRGGHIHGPGPISSTDGPQSCISFYNDVDDVLLENLEVDRCGIGINIGAGNGITGGDIGNGNVDRVTVRNSHIHDNGLQGFIGGCDDCVVENNLIHDNGWGQARTGDLHGAGADVNSLDRNHNIYVACGKLSLGTCNRMRVIGNTLYHSSRCEARTPPGASGETCTSLGRLNKCMGTNIVVHARFQSLIIENNKTDETGGVTAGCYGIQLSPYASEVGWFRDAVIRGNKIVNVGAAGISVSACPFCIIESNEIIKIEEPTVTQVAINIPDGSLKAGDDLDSNIVVRNNGIYLEGTDVSLTGIQINTPGSSLAQRVVSNLIVFGPSAATGVSCYSTNNSSTNFTSWNYNYCYSNGAAARLNKTTNQTMGSWQGAGFDASGVYGTNPLIDTPVLGNTYSIKPNSSSSVLRHNGHPTLSNRVGIRGQVNPDADAFVGPNPYNATITAPNAPFAR